MNTDEKLNMVMDKLNEMTQVITELQARVEAELNRPVVVHIPDPNRPHIVPNRYGNVWQSMKKAVVR